MRYLCNVCGSRLITRFPKVIDPATGEAFAVKKCVECGLGHTLPQPEDPGRYYGTVYYGNRHGITSAFCTRRRLRFVAAFATPSAGGRLLDIGCGDGTFLIAAKEAGWEVMGIEVHPEPR